uniref:Uncharacterized protein n=1 Tax=Arundo donax TaxID=35708 RepID=A0A0A9FVX5_ARUDO
MILLSFDNDRPFHLLIAM